MKFTQTAEVSRTVVPAPTLAAFMLRLPELGAGMAALITSPGTGGARINVMRRKAT